MANNPRDNTTNPQDRPEDRKDKTNVGDPNRDRDNDGGRRQQEAQQNQRGQQGQQGQNPQQQRPDDKRDQRKPQQS